MAADAPITEASTRAPVFETPRDQLLSRIRDIQLAAELIDAVILGVEVMLHDQRRIMREANVSSFFLNNELWVGVETLLTTVRSQATTIGELGEAIEVTEMRVPDAPAAA